MNIMYEDRVFIAIPDYCELDLSLIERIVNANRLRERPYDLSSLIDQRTIDKVLDVEPNQKITCWSFYLPTKDCPLDYRELAVWFVLWSIALGTKKIKGRGRLFKQTFAGLETMLGLGQRQARPICERLHDKGMIVLRLGNGTAWNQFLMKVDFRDCAHWFQPIEGKDKVFDSDLLAMCKELEQHKIADVVITEVKQFDPQHEHERRRADQQAAQAAREQWILAQKERERELQKRKEQEREEAEKRWEENLNNTIPIAEQTVIITYNEAVKLLPDATREEQGVLFKSTDRKKTIEELLTARKVKHDKPEL